MKLKLQSKQNIVWWFSLIFALTGVILMVLDCYTRNDSQFRREPAWYEKVILPFYFTFISNLMAVALPLVKLTPLNKNKHLVRNIEVLTCVNLLATMIVYWSTLYTEHNVKTNIAWASNAFVHTATPILIITIVLVFAWIDRKPHVYKNIYVSSAKRLWFLFVWIILALIIYFALGMKKDGAIYFFLDVAHIKWWETLLFAVFSLITYYIFVLGFIWLISKLSKR